MTDPVVWEPIRSKDCLRNFRCGVSEIDTWAKNKAFKRHQRGQSNVTVGYADGSVSGSSFIALSLTHEDSRKLLHADHSSLWPSGAPLIYIEYLAVSTPNQKKKIGSNLLMQTFERAYAVRQHVPIYGVALRSLNDKTTKFYQDLGFQIAPKEPEQHPLMIMDIWTISDLIEGR